MTPDYFAFLELPRRLSLDLKELETRFYSLSRKLHPDLFARKGAAERAQAEESSATLNDAYRTLRDPVKRAQYLLKLEGFDIGEQSTKDVPPDLLEEVFELNMAIEDGEDLRPRFDAMLQASDAEMRGLFEAWDAGGNRDTLTQLRGALNKRKYITNLIAKTNVPD